MSWSFAERDRRWVLADRLMAREGLDALLVHGERPGAMPAPFAPDAWLSGAAPGALVLEPRLRSPRAIVHRAPSLDPESEFSGRGWLAPAHVVEGPVVDRLSRLVAELCLRDARVGVVGLEPYPPFFRDAPCPTHARGGHGVRARA